MATCVVTYSCICILHNVLKVCVRNGLLSALFRLRVHREVINRIFVCTDFGVKCITMKAICNIHARAVINLIFLFEEFLMVIRLQ